MPYAGKSFLLRRWRWRCHKIRLDNLAIEAEPEFGAPAFHWVYGSRGLCQLEADVTANKPRDRQLKMPAEIDATSVTITGVFLAKTGDDARSKAAVSVRVILRALGRVEATSASNVCRSS